MSWLPKRKILVPLDFDSPSAQALEAAKAMVPSPESITVLHVLPKLSSMEPGVVAGSTTDALRTEKALAVVRKKLADEGESGVVEVLVRIGSPEKLIVAVSKEIDADLIVLTSRGHSRAHDFFLGSTVDGVLHATQRPVLVLRHQ